MAEIPSYPERRFCVAMQAEDGLRTGAMSAGVSRESAQSHLDLYERRGINPGYALYELVPVSEMDKLRNLICAVADWKRSRGWDPSAEGRVEAALGSLSTELLATADLP